MLTNIFLVLPSLPLIIVLAGYLPQRGVASVAVVIAVTGWAGVPGCCGPRPSRYGGATSWRRPGPAAKVPGGSSSSRSCPSCCRSSPPASWPRSSARSWPRPGWPSSAWPTSSTVSWGTMLYFAQNGQALLIGAWWWFIPPGLCIALIGTGLALVNFGIDELVNPRLRDDPGPEGPRMNVLEIRDLGAVRLPSGTRRRCTPSRDVARPAPGRVLGLAGESGSGKSTLANARRPGCCAHPAVITARHGRPPRPATAQPVDVLGARPRRAARVPLEGDRVVFQSAMNALNPVQHDRRPVRRRPPGAPARACARGARERARASCSTWSASTADRLRATRTSCPAACASASLIAMALALTRRSSSWTSRPPRSTWCRSARSSTSSGRCGTSRLRGRLHHPRPVPALEIADRIAIMYAGRRGRDGAGRGAARAPSTPVHAGPAALVPPAARAARGTARHPRHPAGPALAAAGLRLPSALPVRHGHVLGAPARAGPGRGSGRSRAC